MASDSGTTLYDYAKIKFTVDKLCSKATCSIPTVIFKVRATISRSMVPRLCGCLPH